MVLQVVTESSVWSLLNWRYHTSVLDLSKHSNDLGSVRTLGVSISQNWWQLSNHQKVHSKHFVFTVMRTRFEAPGIQVMNKTAWLSI